MTNYKNLTKRYETIREFCIANKEGLIIISGILAEIQGLAKIDDYCKFMNELPTDVFVGNYLVALFNPGAVDEYKDCINGKSTLRDYVECNLGDEILEKFDMEVSKRGA